MTFNHWSQFIGWAQAPFGSGCVRCVAALQKLSLWLLVAARASWGPLLILVLYVGQSVRSELWPHRLSSSDEILHRGMRLGKIFWEFNDVVDKQINSLPVMRWMINHSCCADILRFARWRHVSHFSSATIRTLSVLSCYYDYYENGFLVWTVSFVCSMLNVKYKYIFCIYVMNV
jgi:hypothetical protein